MDVVPISVISTKHYLNNMKKLLKTIKKAWMDEKGEMSFEKQVLVFIVILFALWVLFGGPQKPVENDSLFVPLNTLQ